MIYPPVDYNSFQPHPVVGIDEAGRGCLAGPVFAGAVILSFPEKFKDSKLLTAKKREFFSQQIKEKHKFAIGVANLEEIEKLNIQGASLLAMKRAVNQLKISTGHLLIDGSFCIKELTQFSQTPLVKGDRRAHPISAAGILAKTERDKMLTKLSKIYPEYGFDKHKGYATQIHKKAIKKYGPCPIHRKTFSGVKEYL
ncbi:MAG: ribonuclease HII [Bdellovibrionaceae bacterium]|nr:ribonuclease HII [Pseudobdellovibrionaceae bacterium]